MKIINLEQGSSYWHNWRAVGIGSTDIAPLMGKCKYRTALDVFNDKIGLADPAYENSFMRRGKEYEFEALTWFSSKLRTSFVSPCIEHVEASFMHSSLDWYSEEKQIIAEIKVPAPATYEKLSSSKSAWKEYEERYMYQLQWHMAVSGFDSIYFVVYSPENQGAIFTLVQRDSPLISEMVAVASTFWANLQKGIAPEFSESEMLVLNPEEARDLCERYEEVSRKKKIMEDELKALRDQILDFGDDGDFKIWNLECKRYQGRTSYDTKKMLEDGLDLSKYEKKSIGFYTIKVKE